MANILAGKILENLARKARHKADAGSPAVGIPQLRASDEALLKDLIYSNKKTQTETCTQDQSGSGKTGPAGRNLMTLAELAKAARRERQ
jgi:hypothetical protein